MYFWLKFFDFRAIFPRSFWYNTLPFGPLVDMDWSMMKRIEDQATDLGWQDLVHMWLLISSHAFCWIHGTPIKFDGLRRGLHAIDSELEQEAWARWKRTHMISVDTERIGFHGPKATPPPCMHVSWSTRHYFQIEPLTKTCTTSTGMTLDGSLDGFLFVDFQVGDPTPAADSGLPVREPGESQFHSEGSWIFRKFFLFPMIFFPLIDQPH